MILEKFHNSPTGHLVSISGTTNGQDWTHGAFVPDSLGDTAPTLSPTAYLAVADARAELAALDATAARLPNPRLLRHAFIRLEAQATAALEGTYESLADVLGVEPQEAKSASMTEVLNYLHVADLAFDWSEASRPWSVSVLEELHRLLMKGTSGERDFHGLRPIQVVVGRRDDAAPFDLPIKASRYVPPPPGSDLRARLVDLLDWTNVAQRTGFDPVIAAAMAHYTFEALHPFHDGNGRIGRLFIVLHLHRLGVLTEPSITVSPWFESRRQRYYDALLGVSTEGDWSTWVTFFSQGLAASAATARQRMLALTDVQAHLKHLLQTTSLRTANARRLIDFAVARPTFSVRQVADELGIQRPGAKRLIDAMVELGLLAEYGHRSYGRRFHSPAVLHALTTNATARNATRSEYAQ